jgi:hypothetical protein
MSKYPPASIPRLGAAWTAVAELVEVAPEIDPASALEGASDPEPAIDPPAAAAAWSPEVFGWTVLALRPAGFAQWGPDRKPALQGTVLLP